MHAVIGWRYADVDKPMPVFVFGHDTCDVSGGVSLDARVFVR